MPKTPAEMVMMPVVYRLPGMEDAQVISNLKYSDVDNPNLLMDVYLPGDIAEGERRPGLLPVMLFIHGGGKPEYRAKDWGVFRSWGRLIAASGMVGVTFTHRMGYPVPLLEEAMADLASALAYVRSNAESWNADVERIGLVAFSAGGPLLAAPDPAVRCMVALYALLDMEPPAVPMFIARAGQDAVPGLNEKMGGFIAAALAANAPLTVVNHPAGEHGFDMLNDDDRSREIIRGAIEFMKAHLGAGASDGRALTVAAL
jgi:acetyl esterase/lipase